MTDKFREHIIVFILSLITLSLIPSRLNAVSNISKYLYASKLKSDQFEIGLIEFVGNKRFLSKDLKNVVMSRETDKSTYHEIFEKLKIELKRNPSTPNQVLNNVTQILKSMENEIKFFDINRTIVDSLSLWHYYNRRGYHDIVVSSEFVADTIEKINKLIFYITENERYSIDTINYTGLEVLPPTVKKEVERITNPAQKSDEFLEDNILRDISLIKNILLDSGFYFASYEDPPIVFRDSSLKKDSIVIRIKPGIRQKIGQILFLDSLKGQPPVALRGKLYQLSFKEGDWYNRTKIAQSEDNLRLLGTFGLVKIDTVQGAKTNDSTLTMRVFTQYRKLQDWDIGWFLNQTTFDKAINTGIEFSYVHRNLFGGAQIFNWFSKLVLRDLNRIFDPNITDKIELEVQTGFKYGQNNLWKIRDNRIGLFFNPIYSYMYVYGSLPISTTTLPWKFPITLPTFTYFNTWSFEFSVEWQVPINFDEAKMKAFTFASTPEDSAYIRQALLYYEILDNYNAEQAWYSPTANIIGVSFYADKRDNIFSPKRGHYAAISVDAGGIIPVGVAQYARMQLAYYLYASTNRYTVFAFKGRFGTTLRWGDLSSSYVPFERHFYCGGANSVRGWSARRLRYTELTAEDLGSEEIYTFSQDYMGNATIIEGTAELRYRFQQTGKLGDFWDEQLSSMGISAFIDIGNAFGWYVDTKTVMKPEYYLTKLGISAGVGFRYETPVGPFRIDFAWPIFDPTDKLNPWVTDKVFFRDFVFHIAIGNSF